MFTVWASLVAQWLRIRLPVQGTRVRALVREDPTCRRAAKPMRHNYWACTLQPVSNEYWSPCSATREATAIRSPRTATKSSPSSPQLEIAHMQRQKPNTAKKKSSQYMGVWGLVKESSINILISLGRGKKYIPIGAWKHIYQNINILVVDYWLIFGYFPLLSDFSQVFFFF